MIPEQPQEQQTEISPPTTSMATVAPKPSIKWPIILMVWPISAIILSILLYATINFLFGIFEHPTGTNLFGDQSPLKTIINVILFLVGAISVALGPISFIVGLVILIQRLAKK